MCAESHSRHALGTWDGVNAMYVFRSPFRSSLLVSGAKGAGVWYSPATRWPHGKFRDGMAFQSFTLSLKRLASMTIIYCEPKGNYLGK